MIIYSLCFSVYFSVHICHVSINGILCFGGVSERDDVSIVRWEKFVFVVYLDFGMLCLFAFIIRFVMILFAVCLLSGCVILCMVCFFL